MRKRVIVLLIALMMLFSLAACDNSLTSVEPNSGAADGFSVYNLSPLPGTYSVPQKYYVYSEESGYTDEMCKEQGSAYSNVSQYLSLSDNDVMIIDKDQPIANNDMTIYIKVKTGDYGSKDMTEYSDAEFTAIADSLVAGFGVSDYDVVEGSGLKYIVFENKTIKNTLRYATILNGKMVYVYAEFRSSLSESDRSDLKAIALSIKKQ